MSEISETDLILNDDQSVYHLNLKPEHLSETIITVGDPGRVYTVSQFFDDVDFEMNKREFITHIGNYKGKRITVMSTGMGTDNIEVVLTELDVLANIDLKSRTINPNKKKLEIIRIGTSASIQSDIRLGSHLVSNYAVGLDGLMNFFDLPQNEFESNIGKKLQEQLGFDFTPYIVKGSENLKKRVAFDMIEGNTLTAPGFYVPQGRKLRITPKHQNLIDKLGYFHEDDFWLTNFEMETAGYYALGNLLGHEVLSLNAIIANRVRNRFSKKPAKVIESLIKKVLERI
ncbi:MAG: nucleoside phosphorylase [Bacteroidota bacterium]